METITKSRRTSATEATQSLDECWRELLGNNELRITAGDGSQGGITLANGRPLLWAHDNQGTKIDPVERRRELGAHQLIWQFFRSCKPDDLKGAIRFGPPPAPQRDGFLVANRLHERSIMRRPHVSFRLGSGREIGCVYNGWPFSLEGHFLGLICEFTGEDISYPWIDQRLSFDTIKVILDLGLAVGPSYAVGVNAIGFGASQEQFHVQITKETPYPVERAARFQLAGGGCFPLYPAGCLILEDASPETLWEWARRLGAYGAVPTLLVRERTAYVFPRRPGVGIVPEFPAGLIAFSELSGRWICSDATLYEALDEECLRIALRKSTLSVEEAWTLIIR